MTTSRFQNLDGNGTSTNLVSDTQWWSTLNVLQVFSRMSDPRRKKLRGSLLHETTCEKLKVLHHCVPLVPYVEHCFRLVTSVWWVILFCALLYPSTPVTLCCKFQVRAKKSAEIS